MATPGKPGRRKATGLRRHCCVTAAGLPKRGSMSKLLKLSGLLAVAVAASVTLARPAGAAAAQATSQPAAGADSAANRGLNYAGLNPASSGRCANTFELVNSTREACTHGPDPAPAGVDVKERDRF